MQVQSVVSIVDKLVDFLNLAIKKKNEYGPSASVGWPADENPAYPYEYIGRHTDKLVLITYIYMGRNISPTLNYRGLNVFRYLSK